MHRRLLTIFLVSIMITSSFTMHLAFAQPAGYAPTQMWTAYGFDKLLCTHTTTTDWTDPNLCGHGQTIAIVDYSDDPNIANDLQIFDTQFGLPACSVANGCFVKDTPQGIPGTNSAWALEISLDVEWAHSIAPGAKILLVEASGDIFGAVDAAVATGARQVSMSWIFPDEFSTELSLDSHFLSTTTSFFASSGDLGTGVGYPAASPHVVSVGGTTLNLDSSGNRISETGWSGSGGGISAYESKPSYQNGFLLGTQRGVPDVAYDADLNTGVAVYDSFVYSGWLQVGGTSAGAPQWAGISAIANSQNENLASAPFGANTALYGSALGIPSRTPYTSNYYDITSGTNGNCGAVCTAGPGYDEVTGLGSPQVYNLLSYNSPAYCDFSGLINAPSSIKLTTKEQAAEKLLLNECLGWGRISLSTYNAGIEALQRMSSGPPPGPPKVP